MNITKGTKLRVEHSRKGQFVGEATKDFDTQDEWYSIKLSSGEAHKLGSGFGSSFSGYEIGDDVPCRNSLCHIEVLEVASVDIEEKAEVEETESSGTLSFTIDPSIINLPRSLYWFEHKQTKALDILDSLSSGQLKITQCRALLNGDAYFITEDGGKTLTLVNEEDIEWKKKLAKHIVFLASEKKRLEEDKVRQEEYITKDEFVFDEDRQDYVADFGKTLEELQQQANLKIASALFVNKWANGKEDDKVADDLIKKFTTKKYSFIFKSHEYTFNDSARNQGHCPHCDHKSNGGFHYNPREDKDAFIGQHMENKMQFMNCFECTKCFKKFYVHTETKEDD